MFVFVFDPFSTGGGLSRSDKSNLGAVEFETQIPQTAVPGFQEQNARIYVCGVFELEINQIYLKVLRQGTYIFVFILVLSLMRALCVRNFKSQIKQVSESFSLHSNMLRYKKQDNCKIRNIYQPPFSTNVCPFVDRNPKRHVKMFDNIRRRG